MVSMAKFKIVLWTLEDFLTVKTKKIKYALWLLKIFIGKQKHAFHEMVKKTF